MENCIVQTLAKFFERRRIVFWYDAKKELRHQFDSFSLPNIEKLEIANNEYGIKYRILREQPENKFLLYREGAQPADLENWLLDVQLAHSVFSADQTAIWISELDLDVGLTEPVQMHAEFFRAGKRKETLKNRLHSDETHTSIRLKMLEICAGSESGIDSVVETLLQELADKKEEKIKMIKRCNLDDFLWKQMFSCYGYKSEEPNIRDFVIDLFKKCYALGTDGDLRLTKDSLVFFKRWKNNRQFEMCFEVHSTDCAEVLGIEQDLATRDLREVMELDYFRSIDLKVINELIKSVVNRTASAEEVAHLIRERRQSHWFKEFQYIYEAIEYASQFISTLDATHLAMDTVSEGIQRYYKHWFRLDQLYRKFTFSVKESGPITFPGELVSQIENHYSNSYLLKLNDLWQACLNVTQKWSFPGCTMQADFYKDKIKPLCSRGKVCVLISDALRFEIGDELAGKIRSMNGYEVSLEYMVSSLPSYTQLGMAALLPHETLSLTDNSSGQVLVDGKPSVGQAARGKHLKLYHPNSVVLTAEELLEYKSEQLRALYKENDIIYIYQNHIDATGDNLKTEGRVFKAVEETVAELCRIITKLGGENYISRYVVTSDHGFIYQNEPIPESDFIGEKWASGKEGNKENSGMIHYQDRRFILGKNLPEHNSFKKFHSSQLGLIGEMEILIPKSINRLRLKGSGSRFVHGGASLQEIVIPVLVIHKKRHSDVSMVEVDILRTSNLTISSGQLAVAFYQTLPVADKIQPRTLRIGIYTEGGKLISDSHDLNFDLKSENPREREIQKRFILSRDADEVNDQEVILRLDEKQGGTSHFKEYKSLRYRLRRSSFSDFDI